MLFRDLIIDNTYQIVDEIGSSETVYVEQLRSARDYAKKGDYQKAIVYYKQAIEKDGSNEEAYIELANVYFDLQKSNDGIEWLKLGYERTKSNRILELLRQNGYDYASGEKTTVPPKSETTEKVSVNNVYSHIFSSYTYEKYAAEYTKDKESFANSVYKISYVQFDADFEYVDSEENKARQTHENNVMKD